jgi:hypothetical protein
MGQEPTVSAPVGQSFIVRDLEEQDHNGQSVGTSTGGANHESVYSVACEGCEGERVAVAEERSVCEGQRRGKGREACVRGRGEGREEKRV